MVYAIKNGDKAEKRMYQRFWLSVLSKGIGATLVANLLMAAVDDDDFMERYRKAWRDGGFMRAMQVDITPIAKALGDKGGDRKYFKLMGHFLDPFKFVLHPVRSLHHKGSVAYRTFYEAISGQDWRGRNFTTLSELLGIDDKGYYLTNTKTHKMGEPKGGKLKGKLVSYRAKPGAVGYTNAISYALAQVRGMTPIQVQNALALAAGEMDAFDAISKSLGFATTSTHTNRRQKIDEFTDEYVRLREQKKPIRELQKRVIVYNRDNKDKRIAWKYLVRHAEKVLKAKRIAARKNK